MKNIILLICLFYNFCGLTQNYGKTVGTIMKTNMLNNIYDTLRIEVNDTLLIGIVKRDLTTIRVYPTKDTTCFQIIVFSKNQPNFPLRTSNYIDNKLSGISTVKTQYYLTIDRYLAGKKEGLQLDYMVDKDTSVKAISNYRNGVQHGKEFIFFKNGLLGKESVYKKGNPNGVCKMYFESGNLKSVGRYKGALIFKRNSNTEFFRWFYKNQEVKEIPDYLPSDEIQISSGALYPKRKGKWKFYDENGKLIEEIKY